MITPCPMRASRWRRIPTTRRSSKAAAEAEAAQKAGRFLIPSTIREEKATNPFLRAGEPALAKSVGLEGAPPLAVFQALREWKNKF